MSEHLYLSRARLRTCRGEALSAIAPILMPDDATRRAGHAHRLIWLLFQDVPDAARDFLWRDDGNGRSMVLSRRPPTDPNGLFDLDTKPFAPDLSPGDELRFVLRTNPTVARKGANDASVTNGRQRGKRVDIVMDKLHALPKSERAERRDEIAAEAGQNWLAEQGNRSGFTLKSVVVGSYGQIDIADHDRKNRRARAGVSVMDLEGVLAITDPAAFLAKLAQGFGAAKAFGNGLMLIRRL